MIEKCKEKINFFMEKCYEYLDFSVKIVYNVYGCMERKEAIE